MPPIINQPAAPTYTRREVKRAEQTLDDAGFDTGRVDGTVSVKTTDSVRRFQQATGLAATGQLDDATFEQLRTVQRRMNRSDDATRGVGQAGARVQNIEQRLRALGYDTGRVDGVFDASTARAVRAFKADQPELKDDSGAIGQRAQQSLRREVDQLRHEPRRGRKMVKSRAHRAHLQRLDERAADRAAQRHDEGRGFGVGARGVTVKYAQQHLKAAGFDPQRADGVFDERTAGALQAYQRREGLEATGRVDPTTWRHLKKATMEASSATSPRQREGEQSAAVKRTEQLLKQVGVDPGKVDGLYTEQTQRALDRFRRRHDFGGIGDGVGPNTLRALKRDVSKRKGVTLNELQRSMPGLERGRAKALLPHLNRAMYEFGITNDKRRAAFLAQVGHESVSLRYFQEIWGPTAAQLGYEGRSDLGNNRPGDGYRFRGRGPIQITGRANYRRYGDLLDLPLTKKPGLASTFKHGMRIAAAFWATHGLNGKADRGDFYGITTTINGGTNGIEDRYHRWALAKRALR